MRVPPAIYLILVKAALERHLRSLNAYRGERVRWSDGIDGDIARSRRTAR
jgi:hypothetical protein